VEGREVRKAWHKTVVGAAAVILVAAGTRGALVRLACERSNLDVARLAVSSADPDETIVSWDTGAPMGGAASTLVVFGDLKRSPTTPTTSAATGSRSGMRCD
jgi:hypothetical protein